MWDVSGKMLDFGERVQVAFFTRESGGFVRVSCRNILNKLVLFENDFFCTFNVIIVASYILSHEKD